jgi:hypothetical protein
VRVRVIGGGGRNGLYGWVVVDRRRRGSVVLLDNGERVHYWPSQIRLLSIIEKLGQLA